MAALDRTFINDTYGRVNSLKQAPSFWYQKPAFAYIPLVGVLVSSLAQFSFHTQLDELEKALKDIRMTPLALDIQRKAIGISRLMSFPAVENRCEDLSGEIAGLQQKVETLQRKTPGIASRALKLIEASNQHAIVTIIQGVLLLAWAVSMVVSEILKPAIGMPLFMVCAMVTAGHSGILARNKLEKTRFFKSEVGVIA